MDLRIVSDVGEETQLLKGFWDMVERMVKRYRGVKNVERSDLLQFMEVQNSEFRNPIFVLAGGGSTEFMTKDEEFYFLIWNPALTNRASSYMAGTFTGFILSIVESHEHLFVNEK